MRVAMLSWEYPPVMVGGLGRHVDGLSRALARRGDTVTVVTRGAGALAPPRPAAGDRSHGADRLTVLRSADDGLAIDFDTESLLAWAATQEHALVRAALPHLLSHPPDVVHAHDWLVSQSAVTLARATGAPLVTTVHATEWGRHRGDLSTSLRRAIDSVERWLVGQSDRVVVCSDAMRGEVVDRLGAPADRVDVVANGVDVETWAGRRRGDPGRPTVLFAGRLEWEKGVHVLVDALPGLRRRHPGLRVRVAGDGSQLDALREVARRRRVATAVEFVGRVSDIELAAEFRAADVAVVPSLYEPFGLVALEAAAAGTPRVVSAVGGLADLVRDGVTGRSVAPGNSAELGAAVSDLLDDPMAARRMAAAARREVRRHHGWDAIAVRTAEVFQRARRRGSTGLSSAERPA